MLFKGYVILKTNILRAIFSLHLFGLTNDKFFSMHIQSFHGTYPIMLNVTVGSFFAALFPRFCLQIFFVPRFTFDGFSRWLTFTFTPRSSAPLPWSWFFPRPEVLLKNWNGNNRTNSRDHNLQGKEESFPIFPECCFSTPRRPQLNSPLLASNKIWRKSSIDE